MINDRVTVDDSCGTACRSGGADGPSEAGRREETRSEHEQPSGARALPARMFVGFTWFCTALVILWFFGSLALGPWERAARAGPMPLPWGGRFDLTLGRGEPAHCAAQVTRAGKTTELVLMDGACDRMAVGAWIAANKPLPQFKDAVFGMPYTISPSPESEAAKTRTRVIVSLAITLASALTGVALMLGSVAVAAWVLRPRR